MKKKILWLKTGLLAAFIAAGVLFAGCVDNDSENDSENNSYDIIARESYDKKYLTLKDFNGLQHSVTQNQMKELADGLCVSSYINRVTIIDGTDREKALLEKVSGVPMNEQLGAIREGTAYLNRVMGEKNNYGFSISEASAGNFGREAAEIANQTGVTRYLLGRGGEKDIQGLADLLDFTSADIDKDHLRYLYSKKGMVYSTSDSSTDVLVVQEGFKGIALVNTPTVGILNQSGNDIILSNTCIWYNGPTEHLKFADGGTVGILNGTPLNTLGAQYYGEYQQHVNAWNDWTASLGSGSVEEKPAGITPEDGGGKTGEENIPTDQRLVRIEVYASLGDEKILISSWDNNYKLPAGTVETQISVENGTLETVNGFILKRQPFKDGTVNWVSVPERGQMNRYIVWDKKGLARGIYLSTMSGEASLVKAGAAVQSLNGSRNITFSKDQTTFPIETPSDVTEISLSITAADSYSRIELLDGEIVLGTVKGRGLDNPVMTVHLPLKSGTYSIRITSSDGEKIMNYPVIVSVAGQADGTVSPNSVPMPADGMS